MSRQPVNTQQILKARNRVGFAYSDREVDQVNYARNIESGYTYHQMFSADEREVFTNILKKSDGDFLRDHAGRMVVEMPACDAVGRDSPISGHLHRQFEFLDLLQRQQPPIYPIKILFPYKLVGWHWNSAEIIVSQDAKGFKIEGCAYDSSGRGQLAPQIQREIQDFFQNHFPGQRINFELNKISPVRTKVQTGVACGLYAARSMHNLKTKDPIHIWDGVIERGIFGTSHRGEKVLRDEDSELVLRYNHSAIEKFCAPINENAYVDPGSLSNTAYQEEKNSARNMFEKIKALENNCLENNQKKREFIAILSRIADVNEQNRTAVYNSAYQEFGRISTELRDVFFTTYLGQRDEIKFTPDSIKLVFTHYTYREKNPVLNSTTTVPRALPKQEPKKEVKHDSNVQKVFVDLLPKITQDDERQKVIDVLKKAVEESKLPRPNLTSIYDQAFNSLFEVSIEVAQGFFVLNDSWNRESNVVDISLYDTVIAELSKLQEKSVVQSSSEDLEDKTKYMEALHFIQNIYADHVRMLFRRESGPLSVGAKESSGLSSNLQKVIIELQELSNSVFKDFEFKDPSIITELLKNLAISEALIAQEVREERAKNSGILCQLYPDSYDLANGVAVRKNNGESISLEDVEKEIGNRVDTEQDLDRAQPRLGSPDQNHQVHPKVLELKRLAAEFIEISDLLEGIAADGELINAKFRNYNFGNKHDLLQEPKAAIGFLVKNNRTQDERGQEITTAVGYGLIDEMRKIIETKDSDLNQGNCSSAIDNLGTLLFFAGSDGLGTRHAKSAHAALIADLRSVTVAKKTIKDISEIADGKRLELQRAESNDRSVETVIKIDGQLYKAIEGEALERIESLKVFFNADEFIVKTEKDLELLSSKRNSKPLISDVKELQSVIKKLKNNEELDNKDKSKMLMIHGAFFSIPSTEREHIVRYNNNMELGKLEWIELLQFIIDGKIAEVENPDLKLALETCNLEMLARIDGLYPQNSGGDRTSIVTEFFQGSQHDWYKEASGVTIGRDTTVGASDEAEIIAGKKYCLCEGDGGGHYFGLVFGKIEADSKLKVYVQDSTEADTERAVYLNRIRKIYSQAEISEDQIEIVKTCVKNTEKDFFKGSGNQCRYAAIVFSEMVLQHSSKQLGQGIIYVQDDFEYKFARWFDSNERVFRKEARTKHDAADNSVKSPTELKDIEQQIKILISGPAQREPSGNITEQQEGGDELLMPLISGLLEEEKFGSAKEAAANSLQIPTQAEIIPNKEEEVEGESAVYRISTLPTLPKENKILKTCSRTDEETENVINFQRSNSENVKVRVLFKFRSGNSTVQYQDGLNWKAFEDNDEWKVSLEDVIAQNKERDSLFVKELQAALDGGKEVTNSDLASLFKQAFEEGYIQASAVIFDKFVAQTADKFDAAALRKFYNVANTLDHEGKVRDRTYENNFNEPVIDLSQRQELKERVTKHIKTCNSQHRKNIVTSSVPIDAIRMSLETSIGPRRYQAILGILRYDCGISLEDLDRYAGNAEEFKKIRFDHEDYRDEGDELTQFNQKAVERLNQDGGKLWEDLDKLLRSEACKKDLKRIVEKLNPSDELREKIERHLLAIYSGGAIEEPFNQLKIILISQRLKAKDLDLDKALDLATRFVFDKESLEALQQDESVQKMGERKPNKEKFEAIFTKYAAFGKISDATQLRKRVVGKVLSQFQKKFAEQIHHLDGIKTVEMDGSEILFRGIDQRSDLTEELIRQQFEDIHVGMSTSDGVSQQLSSYKIQKARVPGPGGLGARASYAAATTFNFAVAAKYAGNEGWIYDVRPKEGKVGTNLQKMAPSYQEIDFEAIDPEEIYAVYKVLQTSSVSNDTTSRTNKIEKVILNPHYKKRKGDSLNLLVERQEIATKEIQSNCGGGGFSVTSGGNNSDGVDVFKSFNEQQIEFHARKYSIGSHLREATSTLMQNKEHSSLVVGSNYNRSFSGIYAASEVVEKDVAATDQSDTASQKKNDALWAYYKEGSDSESGFHCRGWFWGNLDNSTNGNSFKVFLSVEPDDLNRATEILIKNGYFNYQRLPECSQKIPPYSEERVRRRLAIILYAQGDKTEESDKIWAERLNAIEKDFYKAGIKPRPLVSKEKAASGSDADDRKFPGSLYSYYKKDVEDYATWNWRNDNYFSGIEINVAESIKQEICAIKSKISEDKTGVNSSEPSRLNDMLKAEELYLEISKVGPEGTEYIQSGTNISNEKKTNEVKVTILDSDGSLKEETRKVTLERARYFLANDLRRSANTERQTVHLGNSGNITEQQDGGDVLLKSLDKPIPMEQNEASFDQITKEKFGSEQKDAAIGEAIKYEDSNQGPENENQREVVELLRNLLDDKDNISIEGVERITDGRSEKLTLHLPIPQANAGATNLVLGEDAKEEEEEEEEEVEEVIDIHVNDSPTLEPSIKEAETAFNDLSRIVKLGGFSDWAKVEDGVVINLKLRVDGQIKEIGAYKINDQNGSIDIERRKDGSFQKVELSDFLEDVRLYNSDYLELKYKILLTRISQILKDTIAEIVPSVARDTKFPETMAEKNIKEVIASTAKLKSLKEVTKEAGSQDLKDSKFKGALIRINGQLAKVGKKSNKEIWADLSTADKNAVLDEYHEKSGGEKIEASARKILVGYRIVIDGKAEKLPTIPQQESDRLEDVMNFAKDKMNKTNIYEINKEKEQLRRKNHGSFFRTGLVEARAEEIKKEITTNIAQVISCEWLMSSKKIDVTEASNSHASVQRSRSNSSSTDGNSHGH